MNKILKLIESVDPADTEALDEIDARVEFFVNPKEGFRFNETMNRATADGFRMHPVKYQYTRSRDALKAIRPEGWGALLDAGNTDCCSFTLSSTFEGSEGYYEEIEYQSPFLKTEELAELHAIIQAIEYERENK